MTRLPDRGEDAALAAVRRGQILDAAAEVFSRRGFHAASMAEIARSFGMSAGHIYNWFDSKEAIIEALVARDIENFLQFAAAARDDGDVPRVLVDEVDPGAERGLDPKRAALQIEILAEASRNPKVAAIVQAADKRVRDGLCSLMAAPLALQADSPELAARVDMLIAMFEGFMVRGLRHPQLDREACKLRLREAVAQVLKT